MTYRRAAATTPSIHSSHLDISNLLTLSQSLQFSHPAPLYLYLLCYILQPLCSGSILITRIASLLLYIMDKNFKRLLSFASQVIRLLETWFTLTPDPHPPFHLYMCTHFATACSVMLQRCVACKLVTHCGIIYVFKNM